MEGLAFAEGWPLLGEVGCGRQPTEGIQGWFAHFPWTHGSQAIFQVVAELMAYEGGQWMC